MPERDQPGGVNSDGDLRNMVDPAFQKDMGGNPLQEGIWATTDGGWQNRKVRDESFASVKKAAVSATVQPGPMGIHNMVLRLLVALKSITINGEPVTPETARGMFPMYGMRNSPNFGQPVEVTAHDPAFLALAQKIIQDSHGNQNAYKDDVQAIQAGIQAGTIQPPPSAATPGPVQAKVAFDLADGFGIDFGSDKQLTHKFIVTSDGRVASLPEPTSHEEVAQSADLTSTFPKQMSLGALYDDGSTDWFQHESGHDVDTLSQMTGDHFGQPVTVDPELKSTTNEERWFGEGTTEQDLIDQKAEKFGPQIQGIENVKTLQRDIQNAQNSQPDEAPAEFQQSNPQEAALYKEYVQALRSGDDRWIRNIQQQMDALRRQGPRKTEQDILQSPSRPRQDFWHPWESEGLVRGGHLDQTIHYPWDLGPKHAVDLTPQFVDDAAGAVGDVATGVKDFAIGDDLSADDALWLIPFGGAAANVARRGGTKLLPKVFNGAKSTKAAPGAEATTWGQKLKNGVKKAPGAGVKALGWHALMNAAGDMAGGGGEEQSGYVPAQSLQQVTHVHSFDSTPTSLDSIPNIDETGDTQEFKDQSTDLNPDNPNNDESGVGSLTPETQAMVDKLFPKVLAYYLSDESAIDDPDVQALEEALRREIPNFDDLDDGDHSEVLGLLQQKQASGNAVVPPRAAPPTGPNPQQRLCTICGGVLNPDASCPQCGAGAAPDAAQLNRATTPGVVAKIAETQGPANPEQFKAVAEALLTAGRHDEIPHMFEAPWEYADLLAEIQGDQTPPPPAVEQPSAPPGAMPPGMDPAMMGAGGPPPGMPMDPTQQIAAAVQRFAADNLAPKCPNCGSHTTGLSGADGACRCHNCGNQWDANAEGTKLRTALRHEELHTDGIDGPPEVEPLVDNQKPDEDVSRNWETSEGAPLEPGQSYELHSDQYSIPDIVKVKAVKPSEIIVSIEGEFEELEDEVSITRDEAEREGLTFVPSAAEDPEAGDQDADEYLQEEVVERPRVNTEPTPAASRSFTTSWNEKLAGRPGHPKAMRRRADDQARPEISDATVESVQTSGGITISLQGDRPETGFAFSPYKHLETKIPEDQFTVDDVNQFIAAHEAELTEPNNYLGAWTSDGFVWLDVSQVVDSRDQALSLAANADQEAIYDLSTFEEIPVPRGQAHDPTPERLEAEASTHTAGLEWLREGGGVSAPAPWQTPLEDLTGESYLQGQEDTGTGPEWLMEGVPRTAGAKFTPREQREFIDEDGEARNLDKLDLSGTHYKTRETSAFVAGRNAMRHAQPEAVDEDHFALGF